MISALPIPLWFALQTSPSDVPSPAPTAAVTAPQTTPQAQAPQESSASPIRKIGGSVLPPKPLHVVDPRYTKEARKAKIEGATTVGLIIDAQGNPIDIHVIHAIADMPNNKKHWDAAHSLDQAAMDAVAKYRFAPATMNGKPVAVQMNIEVNFRIF